MHFDTELYLELEDTTIKLRETLLALEIYHDLVDISDKIKKHKRVKTIYIKDYPINKPLTNIILESGIHKK